MRKPQTIEEILLALALVAEGWVSKPEGDGSAHGKPSDSAPKGALGPTRDVSLALYWKHEYEAARGVTERERVRADALVELEQARRRADVPILDPAGRQLRIHRMKGEGLSTEEIAVREQVSERYVRRVVSSVRAGD